MDVLPRLIELVGEENISTDPIDLEVYGLDWTRFYQPNPMAVVFARNIDQVIALVRFARTQKLALVPSGGRTGLSGGACATNGELVVSFKKMDAILDFNSAASSITVQPGVITANLQAYAQQQQLFYPVDFASSGSSQIGGNLATNAGGIRVLRYGMTRQQVSGMKVVTGKGDLLELNRGLAKNNTGFDLRHLFIGSEGTLGFIVEATLQLLPVPERSKVALLAINRMEDCLDILTAFRARTILNAFEFFSDAAISHVVSASGFKRPFPAPSPFYVLLEFEHSGDQALEKAMQAYGICIDSGWVSDGIIGSSDSQNAALWQYRERISESIAVRTPYKNDIAVRIDQVPAFLARASELVGKGYPDFEVIWFGHIGDGNLHLNILRPPGLGVDAFKRQCETVSEDILALVQTFGGSVSAEHGIGLLKKNQLHFSRSPEEIEAMRAIKAVFDPDGIMNPGKLLDV